MVGFLLMPQSVEWGGSICPPRKLLNLTFFCPSQSILTLDSFTIEFVFFLSPWQRGSPALTVLLHRAHPFRTPFRDLLQPRSLPANPAALSVHPRVRTDRAPEPQQSRRASFKWPGHRSHFIFCARRLGLCQ